MKLFELSTYQEIIENHISFEKSLGNKVTFQKLAEIMRIQKSYLSKVMAYSASLSKDQLFLFAQKAHLNDKETDYLFLLLDIEKAANQDLKSILSKKARRISQENTQSQNYLEKENVNLSSDSMNQYYLAAENQLIHLALAIPKYQSNLELLRTDMKISSDSFSKAMTLLESLNLISINGTKAETLKSNIHLSPDSPYFSSWKNQLLLKSIEWEKMLDPADKYNLTVSFTANDEARECIRLEFLKMLKSIEKIVKSAPSENLYQMNFNLFKWI